MKEKCLEWKYFAISKVQIEALLLNEIFLQQNKKLVSCGAVIDRFHCTLVEQILIKPCSALFFFNLQ